MKKTLVMCIALWVLPGCLAMSGGALLMGIGAELTSHIPTEAFGQTAPVYVDPTIPGGSGIRDYSKPSVVIQGGQAQQTYPGTYIPDQRRGGWVVQPGQTTINQPNQGGVLNGQIDGTEKGK
jgi:hypothetical protein